MFGEQALKKAAINMIKNNPELIAELAEQGMKINTSADVNEDGFVVLKTVVTWSGKLVEESETVLPVKADQQCCGCDCK